MRTRITSAYLFCCLATATPFYALTMGKRAKHTENESLRTQSLQYKTRIQPAMTSTPRLNINPPTDTANQIPIAVTTLLTPTASQITAVSNIEA